MKPQRKPSRADPSRPREDGYAYKKAFYRSETVARDYDFHRLGSKQRQRRDGRKWRAIEHALSLTNDVRTVLDMPCGTGRFTGRLAREGYRVVGADISEQMMLEARGKTGDEKGLLGFIQADGEALPFRDGALDCVVCIRFMFHVDPATRVRILREMGRVSPRWQIVDYRHRYTLRWVKWRLMQALGWTRRTLARVSRAEMEREFRQAGLTIRKIVPVRRGLSDKWVVLSERRSD